MRGVVFDFDGVIARSMEQHAEAYRRVLAPLGVPVTPRDVLVREGARSETIIADLARAVGVKLDDVPGLADEKQKVFRSLGDIALYPGAEDVVRRCAGAAPVGLVTGTRRSNLERLIPQLVPVFAAVLAQEDYSHDKPHPEPYARAAERLGIDATDLIAVENARRGVESAKAAGYGHVVAITTTLTATDLAAADAIVADHNALARHLADHLRPS